MIFFSYSYCYSSNREEIYCTLCLVMRLKNRPLIGLSLFFKVGTAIDHDNFTERIYRKDIYECVLRQIRFHDLRHTSITLMVQKGALLPVIQKIAGHKDIKTTMRYVHVLGKDIDDIGALQGLTVSK